MSDKPYRIVHQNIIETIDGATCNFQITGTLWSEEAFWLYVNNRTLQPGRDWYIKNNKCIMTWYPAAFSNVKMLYAVPKSFTSQAVRKPIMALISPAASGTKFKYPLPSFYNYDEEDDIFVIVDSNVYMPGSINSGPDGTADFFIQNGYICFTFRPARDSTIFLYANMIPPLKDHIERAVSQSLRGLVDGVNKNFQLDYSPSDPRSVIVTFDSGVQYKIPDFNIIGRNLSFPVAPVVNTLLAAYYNTRDRIRMTEWEFQRLYDENTLHPFLLMGA